MQLHIIRSQKTAGLIAKSVVFCVDARAQYTAEERAKIIKYNLGYVLVYESEKRKAHLAAASDGRGFLSSMLHSIAAGLSLRITLDSLGQGHHIELKSLDELLAAEQAMDEACTQAKLFLEIADGFDGREILKTY
ncbi:MAG: hypothetical protein P9C36_15725 [Defluviicoccus sp.]|nr:hypothetical protein [Defluviicoccus sp.]MDG4594069.1 hypothetical protein [Defluviicoccus sp.]